MQYLYKVINCFVANFKNAHKLHFLLPVSHILFLSTHISCCWHNNTL